MIRELLATAAITGGRSVGAVRGRGLTTATYRA